MSTTTLRIHRAVRALFASVAASVAVGCATANGPAQPRTTVHTVPLTSSVAPSHPMSQAAHDTSAAPAPPQLPALPGERQLAMSPGSTNRLREVAIPAGTSIATAVTQLGAQLGLTVDVDPAVTGTTSANLRNVTLDNALDALVTKAGYQYQLQGNVLRVLAPHMQTRSFTLDYVAISRVGTMNTVVQRRFTNNAAPQVGTATGLSTAAAIGGLNSAAGGGDVVSGQSLADAWTEIRVALAGILKAGERPVTGNNAANAVAEQSSPVNSQQQAGGMIGTAASEQQFADGSSLIISPMSGLITVTAMPDKLAAVESYINSFQASILRQVKIEAKIVEVTLTNSFQYGIDWSVVANAASAKYGVSLRSDPSVQTSGQTGNINFTLQHGSTAVNAILTALSSQGDVHVLSNEQTTALNNQRAIFDVTTDEIFFSVTRTPLLGANGGVVSIQSQIIPQQISVGVVLDVLPQISADNVLTMNIRPAVTSIDHIATITTSDGTSASAPVIARREGDTIARIRAGETMLIGGLVQTRKDSTESGIPILSSLPLIGKAFQHLNVTESRSELVVFLTPTIISGQPASSVGAR